MIDGDAKCKFGRIKVGDFPSREELRFKAVSFAWQGRGNSNVVNMYSEDHFAGGRCPVIDAQFISHALEAPLNYSIMEGFVPNSTCLLHAINKYSSRVA